VGLIADVTAESSSRVSADNSLQSAISSEASTTTAALSSEASTRVSADTSIETGLSSEVASRTLAVSSEQSSRVSGDASLSTALSAEASTRASTDTLLESTLSTHEVTTGNVHNVTFMQACNQENSVTPGTFGVQSSTTLANNGTKYVSYHATLNGQAMIVADSTNTVGVKFQNMRSDIHVSCTWENTNYIERTCYFGYYTTVAAFRYEGSVLAGPILYVRIVTSAVNLGVGEGFLWRLYDRTNSQILGTSSLITDSSIHLDSFSTPNNMPTTPVQLELQTLGTNAAVDAFHSGLVRLYTFQINMTHMN